jgi:hypothetical protein
MDMNRNYSKAIISSILLDLRTVAFRIHLLGLFSPNEAFDEVSVRNVPYMLVQYVVGEMQLRVRSIEPEDRIDIINGAKVCLLLMLHSNSPSSLRLLSIPSCTSWMIMLSYPQKIKSCMQQNCRLMLGSAEMHKLLNIRRRNL